jgi:hypothetical protein
LPIPKNHADCRQVALTGDDDSRVMASEPTLTASCIKSQFAAQRFHPLF